MKSLHNVSWKLAQRFMEAKKILCFHTTSHNYFADTKRHQNTTLSTELLKKITQVYFLKHKHSGLRYCRCRTSCKEAIRSAMTLRRNNFFIPAAQFTIKTFIPASYIISLPTRTVIS